MFGREIWDKLPKCIFENFEIARAKFIRRTYPKNHKHIILKIKSFSRGHLQISDRTFTEQQENAKQYR